MIPIFAAVNVLLYTSFAYLYFFSAQLVPLRPLYLYLITVSVTAVAVLFRQQFKLALKVPRKVALWALTFAIASGGAYLWSRQTPVATSCLVIATHQMTLLVTFLYLFRNGVSVAYAMYAMVAVALFGVAMNVVDYFALEAWRLSIIPGRAAGFYENPNISGQYLVMAMVIGVWAVPRHLRLLFALTVGVGVLLTFSRSAIVVWVIAMVAFIWYDTFPYRKTVVWVGVGGLVAFIAGAILLGSMPDLLEAAGLTDRLNTDTINRMTGSFFSQRDLSSRDRLVVAQQGLHLFLQSPLFGVGLGATREGISIGAPHNMYIMLAAEMGLMGLGLFLGLLWIVWSAKTPVARIIVLVIAVSSVFTHNQLEFVATTIVIALTVSIDPARLFAVRTELAGTRRWASTLRQGGYSGRFPDAF